jgi:hypothetical protein
MCNEFSLVWIHIKQSPNWIPTACSIIFVLRHFGGRCCFHLQGDWTSCGIWIQNMEAACSSIIRVTKQTHYTTQCKTHTISPNLTHQAMCCVQYSLTGLTHSKEWSQFKITCCDMKFFHIFVTPSVSVLLIFIISYIVQLT